MKYSMILQYILQYILQKLQYDYFKILKSYFSIKDILQR